MYNPNEGTKCGFVPYCNKCLVVGSHIGYPMPETKCKLEMLQSPYSIP